MENPTLNPVAYYSNNSALKSTPMATYEKFKLMGQSNYEDIKNADRSLTTGQRLEFIQEALSTAHTYKDRLQKEYSKYFSFNDRIYEAYAIVDSWCEIDEQAALAIEPTTALFSFTQKYESSLLSENECQEGRETTQPHPHARALHYAKNSRKDLALLASNNARCQEKYGNSVILFSEVNKPIGRFLYDLFSADPWEAALSQNDLLRLGALYSYSDICDIYEQESNADQEHGAAIKQENDLAQIYNNIAQFANKDKQYSWRTLEDSDGNTLKVPGLAFLHYCLGQDTEVAKALKPYIPFSPSGLKNKSDNPLHTDCWIGAGLNVDSAYDKDTWQYKLFMESARIAQQQLLEYEFHLITRSGAKEVKGIACSPDNYLNVPQGERILVLPHLGVEFEAAALACDAIVCEQGGPMAHLVIVSKECHRQLPIIRVDNACLSMPYGKRLTLDLYGGKIKADNIKTQTRLSSLSKRV